MKIAVAGSIATDQLMTFDGHFGELFREALPQVFVSFLADELVIRRGGVAANIAFGLAQLGIRPVLLGAVGKDFEEHRASLRGLGVECDFIHVSDKAHTARFICATDRDDNQIASFYAGAMAETGAIRLVPVAEQIGGLDMVVVGASDPGAMLAQAAECRANGYPFAADPSQQLPRMNGEQVVELITGADYLLTNEYEKSLLQSKAGLTDEQLLELVRVRVTTLGKDGVEIAERDGATFHVAVPATIETPDPTGGGDAFRAGFFAALSWDLSLVRAGQLGSLVAGLALERIGAQEYQVDPAVLLDRMRQGYGEEAARDLARHLS
ncbi:carbohydrate kinase family protein [Micromonospora sp. CPCC 205546]|uniref:carbohydrate kinase family protein n=1 Tax=Micromonospora sp. CPCC 205546 TaxID=3122397 RepID=UPI002FF17233